MLRDHLRKPIPPVAIEYNMWQGALELSLPSTLYHEYRYVIPEAYVGLIAEWKHPHSFSDVSIKCFDPDMFRLQARYHR